MSFLLLTMEAAWMDTACTSETETSPSASGERCVPSARCLDQERAKENRAVFLALNFLCWTFGASKLI
jgi:hypothetical protein